MLSSLPLLPTAVPVCVGVLGKPLTILWLRLNARHESAREVAAGLGSGRNRPGVSRAELRPTLERGHRKGTRPGDSGALNKTGDGRSPRRQAVA